VKGLKSMSEYKILMKVLCVELRVHMLFNVPPTSARMVYGFSLQLSSESLVVLRGTEQDMIKMYIGYSRQILTKLYILYIFSKNTQISNVTEICLMGAETDMVRLTVAFRNVANAPEKQRSATNRG
jgi:hypothetical protein